MTLRISPARTLALPLGLAALAALADPAPAQCVLDGERVPFTGTSLEAHLFGITILLDAEGDTALFPNYGDETNGPFSGAVHVWRHDGAGWVPQPKIIPPGLGPDSGFGRGGAVDAAGDTLLVGAWDGLSGTDPGRVYVFQFDGTTWNEETQLVASDAASHLAFGEYLDVDASGTVAVVASNGGAYVFRRVGGVWGEEQILSTVGSGTTIVENVAISADGRTAVYLDQVFRFDGAQWVSHGALVANDGNPLHGELIDDDGDTIVAFVADDFNGTPYVFRHDGASWVEEQRLLMPAGVQSSRTQAAMDAFGETILVFGRAVANGPYTVVEFEHDGSAWIAGQELTATKAGDDLKGAVAVSADATRVVVGTSMPGPFVEGFTSFRCGAPSTFCYGTASACPCANEGLPGRGCDNAGATGGVRLALQAFAPDGAGGGTATLATSGYPAGASPTTVVLRGTQPDALGSALFDGLLCVQGSIARLGASPASGGAASFALTHGAGAGAFHYQTWYRSIPASFCGPVAANLSNGLTLIWP